MALALDLGSLNSRLSREGAQSGALTASLIWNDPSDLDLYAYVKPKQGREEVIYYGKKEACGGFLDVDMNCGRRFSLEPVENIFWQTPPEAQYRIAVRNALTRSSPREWDGRFTDEDRFIPFKVFLKKGGDVQEFSGQCSARCCGPPSEVTCFEFDTGGGGGAGGGGSYLVFPPAGAKTTFKDLCDKHNVTWQVGCGFYAVVRIEKIHAGKEMLLHSTDSDTFVVGSANCRAKLGWPTAGELKKGPKDIPVGHRLYVQSTSYNRVIPPGTHVLFEVDAETYAAHRKTTTIPASGAAPAAEAAAKSKPGAGVKAKASGRATLPPKAKAKAKARAKAKAKAKAKAAGRAPPPPKARATATAKAAGREPPAHAKAKAEANTTGRAGPRTGLRAGAKRAAPPAAGGAARAKGPRGRA